MPYSLSTSKHSSHGGWIRKHRSVPSCQLFLKYSRLRSASHSTLYLTSAFLSILSLTTANSHIGDTTRRWRRFDRWQGASSPTVGRRGLEASETSAHTRAPASHRNTTWLHEPCRSTVDHNTSVHSGCKLFSMLKFTLTSLNLSEKRPCSLPLFVCLL